MAVKPKHIELAVKIVVLKTSLAYCEKKEYIRRRQMRYVRRTRPVYYFFLPGYWRLERDQQLLFKGVINFRKMIVNYEKENQA